uniref:Replication factor C C-terminal domain-containing protein n=1 Tax=Aegilops tauschii subsp. strangulata TaxID=200361 RepID=A0A453PD95_AEGTS
SKHKITEISATKNFKVIVLYDVDKVSENNQRLIKWIIDSSSDSCKIIMTCQDGPHLLDSITNRCKLISIGVPNTREVSFLRVFFCTSIRRIGCVCRLQNKYLMHT